MQIDRKDRRIALGFGYHHKDGRQRIEEIVDKFLQRHQVENLSAIATIESLANSHVARVLNSHFNLDCLFFNAADLEKQAPNLHSPSKRIFELTGCHGVCEGAALAAIGGNGQLLVAKTRCPPLTLALAEEI